MAKFRDFIENNQITKTLSSDGSDPNPTQTLKSASELAANVADDEHRADDIARISAMPPGINRRTAIVDLAGDAIKNNPVGSSRATPMDVSKFLTMQFDKMPKPGESMAGKFNKFMKKMKKSMRKGMKK